MSGDSTAQRSPATSGGGTSELPSELSDALSSLSTMDVAELRAAWRRLYRSEPPKKLRRDTLQLAVAWKLQAQALGGLSAVATRQLATLTRSMSDGADPTKARRISLKPGARLLRHWGGETHEVVVTETGFVWRDRNWVSLSVIAREITGARWSGPRFFGLDRARRAGRRRASGQSTDEGKGESEGESCDAGQ